MSQLANFTGLGRIARLGLIVPQLDLLSEPWFQALLPNGVSIHTSRMARRGPVSSNSLGAMNDTLRQAIDLLPTPHIDAVIYHCTMGSLLFDPEKLKAEITGLTGVPTISTTSSVIRAFEHLGIQDICLVSPYVDELNKAEVEFFERNGLKILHVGGAHLTESIEMSRTTPEEIAAWARATWKEDCKGVFITCTGIRSTDYVAELEEHLGVPVVTSSTAVLWDLCRFLKIPTDNIPLGKLFRS